MRKGMRGPERGIGVPQSPQSCVGITAGMRKDLVLVPSLIDITRDEGPKENTLLVSRS